MNRTVSVSGRPTLSHTLRFLFLCGKTSRIGLGVPELTTPLSLRALALAIQVGFIPKNATFCTKFLRLGSYQAVLEF